MGYVRNVTLWVKKINDDGKEGVHVMRFKELKATRDTIENTDGSIESPNLIGINFLVEHGFKLIIDGKNKTAWLEKED
ncbi:MAG: hypothetical protein HYW26_00360 [Candidatus Aenigmarchaeota archaeon]|nr:hypothetical protein [Candidatus Aenigmarchaeota archaeon]